MSFTLYRSFATRTNRSLNLGTLLPEGTIFMAGKVPAQNNVWSYSFSLTWWRYTIKLAACQHVVHSVLTSDNRDGFQLPPGILQPKVVGSKRCRHRHCRVDCRFRANDNSIFILTTCHQYSNSLGIFLFFS